MGQRRKGVRGSWAQADIFSSPLNGKQEPDRLAPRWALMAEDRFYQTLGTGWEGRKSPPRCSGISSPPSPPYSLSGLDLRPREMSQVLQGYTSWGLTRAESKFPRPPSSQGQQACPDLGQAPAALGFVSLRLEASRGHLILPLALSKRPSTSGVSQSRPASSELLFPLPEAVFPSSPVSCLFCSHFQARPSCSEPSFPGYLISP